MKNKMHKGLEDQIETQLIILWKENKITFHSFENYDKVLRIIKKIILTNNHKFVSREDVLSALSKLKLETDRPIRQRRKR